MSFHRLLPYLPIISFLVLLVFFADNPFVLFDFPVDDAWIHRVYSRSFAFGQGMAYNDYIQETGSTSPLWVIITAPTQWLEPWLGTDAVVIAVKLIGIFLALVAIRCLQLIALRLNVHPWAACFAAALFACDPRLMFSALSGMEPILCISLILGSILAVLQNRPYLLALLLGLNSVSRPECLLFFPFFAFALCWQHQQWRYMLNPKLYLIALLPVIAWLCFCYYVTGYWLPNTFYAKSEPMSISLSILQTSWQSFTLAGWPSTSIIWPVLVSFPVFFILFRKNKLFYTVSILSFSLVAFTIAIASSRNMLLDGYYWTRWSDPANVTLGALFCIGFCQLIFSSALTKHLQLASAKFYNRLISLSTILVFLISIPAYIDSHHKQKFHLTMDARAIRMLNVSSGQWINKNTDKSTIIASMDAGGARYFGMRHTIDLLGLNHHQVLHSNTGFENAISYADMLIVFPEDFSQYGLDDYFNSLTIFSLPINEYTICPCPVQNTHAIIQKKDARAVFQ